MKRTRETWKMTLAARAEMLARYRDGAQPTALAREYGITRQTLLHHARAAGIVPIGAEAGEPGPEDAYTGEWVRVGLILRPVERAREVAS